MWRPLSNVTATDSRAHPLVAIDRATIEAMCAPISNGAALGDITVEGEGLVHTLLRVPTTDGRTYALRISPPDENGAVARRSLASELALLDRLAGALPVPRPIVADVDGSRHRFAFMIYPWIDGMTLNACRRLHGAAALRILAEPLGRLMALTVRMPGVDRSVVPQGSSVSDALSLADVHLRSERVRNRLGPRAADALRSALDAQRSSLEDLERCNGLVHGDLGGRNVVVRQRSDVWEIAGILDWENAFFGSPLWDVGSLFRYASRYSLDFRMAFAHAYADAGGELPDDWWTLSRLLDATRVVAILAGDRELPSVFDDCRAIVSTLI